MLHIKKKLVEMRTKEFVMKIVFGSHVPLFIIIKMFQTIMGNAFQFRTIKKFINIKLAEQTTISQK